MQTRSRKVEMPNGLSLPIGLRYEHSSDRVRSVGLLPERKRQFAEPALHPICLNVRKVPTIHARRTFIKIAWSFALSALTVANDCPKHTFSFRIARLQARKAIDLYFEEVESSLNRI